MLVLAGVIITLMEPFLMGWLNTCLPMASGEGIPWFALLVSTTFALLIEQPLCEPTGSLCFDSPSHPTGAE